MQCLETPRGPSRIYNFLARPTLAPGHMNHCQGPFNQCLRQRRVVKLTFCCRRRRHRRRRSRRGAAGWQPRPTPGCRRRRTGFGRWSTPAERKLQLLPRAQTLHNRPLGNYEGVGADNLAILVWAMSHLDHNSTRGFFQIPGECSSSISWLA